MDINLTDTNLQNSKCQTCVFSREKLKSTVSEIQQYSVKQLQTASAAGATNSVVIDDQSDKDLLEKVNVLNKKCNGMLRTIREVEERKGFIYVLKYAGGDTAAMEGDNRQKEIQLKIDAIQSQAKQDELSQDLLKRILAMKSGLTS